MSKSYSLKEVGNHNKESDLWIIVDDAVYDVTKFLNEHPGGQNPFIHYAGKDASELFHSISAHTDEIEIQLETMRIGLITE